MCHMWIYNKVTLVIIMKYIPISEFVAVTLIGRQVSTDASFRVGADYQQSRYHLELMIVCKHF